MAVSNIGRVTLVLTLAHVLVIVLDIFVHMYFYAYLTGATLVLTLAHVLVIVLDIVVHRVQLVMRTQP